MKHQAKDPQAPCGDAGPRRNRLIKPQANHRVRNVVDPAKPGKRSTVTVTIRIGTQLKTLLSEAARSQDKSLSPFVERLLWSAPEMQRALVSDGPAVPVRRWTLGEIGMAHLMQLGLIANAVDRLVVAVDRSLRDGDPADALRLSERLHEIERELERLAPLQVIRTHPNR